MGDRHLHMWEVYQAVESVDPKERPPPSLCNHREASPTQIALPFLAHPRGNKDTYNLLPAIHQDWCCTISMLEAPGTPGLCSLLTQGVCKTR